MTQPDAISTATLARIADQVMPGATLVRAWRLAGGISTTMTALELALPDGAPRRVILRQPGPWAMANLPQAAALEYATLTGIRAAGVRAPRPLLLDESGELLPAAYLVVEYIEGAVQHSPRDVGAYVTAMAGALAELHRIEGTRPALAALPAINDWLARARAERPEEGDEPLGPRRVRAVLRAAARTAGDGHDGQPMPHPNRPSLLHGDPWPGNILWHAGRIAALIDWEEAHIGDPLEDLAIARFDVLCMLGREGMDGLTAAYCAARPDVDPTDLPLWDLYASLRPVSGMALWAGGWADLGRADVTEAVMRDYHRAFVAQALAASSYSPFTY